MKYIALRTWLRSVALGGGLLLALLGLNFGSAACNPQQPGESCSATYMLAGTINLLSGRPTSDQNNQVGGQPRYSIDKSWSPVAGRLIYLDLKGIEGRAHAL